MTQGFTADDLLALVRAQAVRAEAHSVVKSVQDLLPTLLAPDVGLRVSRVREDFDRVGLFFFVPKLGNTWCGVPLAGPDALHLVIQVPADAVDPARASGAGLLPEPPSFVGRVPLVGVGAPDGDGVPAVLKRWLSAL